MKTQPLIFLSLVILFASQFVHAQNFSLLIQNGEVARQRGEYPKAFESFNQALNIAETWGDKSKQAQTLISLGHLYYLQAKYGAAIRSFRQAGKLASLAKDKREEARAWAFLGQLYWRVGKVEDGEMLLKDALEVFEKTNDEINIALTLRFMGRLENGKILPNNAGLNNKVALRYYERSLAISRRISDEEGELTTLKEIGLVHQTDYKADQYLKKAMSYFEPLRVRLKDSNYRFLYAVILNNIATNEFGSKHYAKSGETADEAAKMFREIGDRQELREMLNRKAYSLSYLDRFTEVLPVIDESIKIADELYYQPIGDALDRSRYFESLIDSYRIKMDILYRLNRPAEMFETHEAMKSLTLREMMNRGKDEKKSALTVDEITEEKCLNDELNSINRQLLQVKKSDKRAAFRLAKLNRQLQKARLAKEEWQANIASENERFAKPNLAENLNISQMCALLPDKKTAFIEYEANKAYLGATFVLMKTDADFAPSVEVKNLLIKNLLTEKITLPDGQTCVLNVFFNKGYWENEKYNQWFMELAVRVSEFREQLARNSPAFKQNAKFIYDALLADGMPLLKDKKHLVIVPSGMICDVPFQALMNENGRYLIEDFSISYTPSLTALAKIRANRQKVAGQKYDGDFLAFGNPKLSAETVAKLRSRYRDGKLENLPEAESEVKTIGKFYSNNRIFVGRNATESVWQTEASKYRILHLATHGLSDGEKPLYSHVLLSADANGDGLIEAREIVEMSLTAEMVVLSACETARGREIDGEGMVGLAWAFAAAGVPTVVASQWKVDSENTADLMVDFYSAINENKQNSKAEAMRRTALEKLAAEKPRHPFYWAGFAVYGDW